MIIEKGNIVKLVFKIFVFALIIGMVLSTCSCKKRQDNENLDKTDDEIISEPTDDSNLPSDEEDDSDITNPTIIVQGAAAKAGEKNVEVIIKIKNNPGILGIDFDIYYNETVMTLVDAKSALDLAGCSFTQPAYYRNPTTFLWDFQDLNWAEDGVILKLNFDILETALVGKYEVKVMYSYGNIFDDEGTPIYLETKNSYISIKE